MPTPDPNVDATTAAASAAMDRYADGDDRAFAVVYDALAPRLYGWLLRRTQDAAIAEDLVQQTFLHMHRARATYLTGADVVPWAFAIARRLTIDSFRRRRREFLWSDHSMENTEMLASEALLPDAAAQTEQALAMLEKTLGALPLVQREAFTLCKCDGLSLAQAAEVLGTTIGNVKVRVHRAVTALRATLLGPAAAEKTALSGELP